MLLPELFKNYLQVEKASSITVKNYLADINHFLEWISQKTAIKYQIVGKGIFGLFTEETLNEYKTEQLIKKTPTSTLNRRLSALRKFGQFGLRQGWLKKNPAITNAGLNLLSKDQDQNNKVLSEFQKQLEKEKISPLTIKNYLSDLRHFLNWLEFS